MKVLFISVRLAAEKDFDWLRVHGAIPVAYGEGLEDRVRTLASSGIDAAIDLVGTDEAIDASLALVADRRGIATIVNVRRARQDCFQALGGETGNDEGANIRDNARYILMALAQSGVLDVRVDRRLPLSAAEQALVLLLEGKVGRLVLEP